MNGECASEGGHFKVLTSNLLKNTEVITLRLPQNNNAQYVIAKHKTLSVARANKSCSRLANDTYSYNMYVVLHENDIYYSKLIDIRKEIRFEYNSSYCSWHYELAIQIVVEIFANQILQKNHPLTVRRTALTHLGSSSLDCCECFVACPG